MGHEAIGVVEAVGAEVRTVKTGDVVVMPFAFSDGTCEFCEHGLHTASIRGGFFGNPEVPGAQAEAIRVPLADGTLYPLPVGEDDVLMPSLLTLSDVMSTGHHAAVTARVEPGVRVAVIGDGAVGPCGVIAAKRLGAEEIVLLGRHADRIALYPDPTVSGVKMTEHISASSDIDPNSPIFQAAEKACQSSASGGSGPTLVPGG